MTKHITLATPCYVVDNGRIKQCTLADFRRYIETTTTPSGIGPKYYATKISRAVDDDEERVTEGWALASCECGREAIVIECESEEEAREEAEKTYVYDILHNNERAIHLDLARAEEELESLLDDE